MLHGHTFARHFTSLKLLFDSIFNTYIRTTTWNCSKVWPHAMSNSLVQKIIIFECYMQLKVASVSWRHTVCVCCVESFNAADHLTNVTYTNKITVFAQNEPKWKTGSKFSLWWWNMINMDDQPNGTCVATYTNAECFSCVISCPC